MERQGFAASFEQGGLRRTGQARYRGLASALAVAALFLLAFAAAPASAAKIHAFQETFGSAAQPTFTSARGVAIDQATGDVLVMDAGGTPSIERYNPDGTVADFSALGTNVIDGKGNGECATVPADCDQTPQNGMSFSPARESQIAVDNSGTATDGNIYVTQSFPNLIHVFSAEGKYLGQLSAAGITGFSEACGVAIGTPGDVYVADYGLGIYKFFPAANPPTNADNLTHFEPVPPVTGPCALAAGAGASAGFLFASQYLGPIAKIDNSTGTLKYIVSSDTHTTISVDPGTGHVYGATGTTINEFDASGASSAMTIASITLATEAQGVAVRGSSGDIYVSRDGNSNIEVFDATLVTLPDVTTAAATPSGGTQATLNGTVNPNGVELTECFFEYGETASYGQTVPCAESPAVIGTGAQPLPVHSSLTGLAFATTYHFRLLARNGNHIVSGPDNTFRTFGPPVIQAQWASSVLDSEATLKAAIRPERLATSAQLEWGTDTSYGNTSALIDVGSGSAARAVSVTLTELQPGTTYHYRFLATNSVSGEVGHPAEGPDHSFTTYPSMGQPTQPDGRAFELVSPSDKNGGDVGGIALGGEFASGFAQSAAGGDAVTYVSLASFGEAQSAKLTTQYLSWRTADGWATRNISPPAPPSATFEDLLSTPISPYSFFSEDLSVGLLKASATLVSGAPQNFDNLYVRGVKSGGYQLVTTVAPANQTPASYQVAFAGASPDFSHVVFEANDALTAGAPINARSVYEWVGATSSLRLVSVLPGSGAVAAASAGAGDGNRSIFTNDVSLDGSRIFWTDNHAQLYVREDGATTVKINASQRTPSLGDGSATFRAATPDGSKVFFTNTTALTDEPNDNGGLYEYDFRSLQLTNLSPSSSGPPGIQGVVGASDNGMSVYFVASSDLASGASAGSNNLYVVNNGVIEFIAALSNSDSSNWAQNLIDRTARVTPDGRHVAFMSNASLTGYDNVDAHTGTPDAQVFVYGSDSRLLSCASCNPSGARPTGPSSLPTAFSPSYTPRSISNDGRRVFFNSEDAILPPDTNGRQDVYEYKDGGVDLISSGTSDAISTFSDANADGSSVFFTTRAQLAPQDQDDNSDMYGARVDGGFPGNASPAPCSGEACRGPLSTPAIRVGVQTATDGAGLEDLLMQAKADKPACRVKAKRLSRKGSVERRGSKTHRAKEKARGPACKVKSRRGSRRSDQS